MVLRVSLFATLIGSHALQDLRYLASWQGASFAQESPFTIFQDAIAFAEKHPGEACHSNSPPCECDNRSTAWNSLTNTRTKSSETMPISRSQAGDGPEITKQTFPVWSHKAADDRKCARFAVDMSGGSSGEQPLQNVVSQLAAEEFVDVFVHMIVPRDSDAAELGNFLQSVFSSNLRAATIEVWNEAVMRHTEAAYEGEDGLLTFMKKHNLVLSNLQLMSMWRNIFLASALRGQYTKQHACKYEVVVRTRPDIVFAPIKYELWASYLKGNSHNIVIGCHAGDDDMCKKRAKQWPAGACWLDDQLAIGSADAVTAYESLFPDYARFAWWVPIEIPDFFKNLPERLLLAHMDWRARAVKTHGSPQFEWSAAGPGGAPLEVTKIDHSQRPHQAPLLGAPEKSEH